MSCLLLLSLAAVAVVGLLSTARLETKGTAAWEGAYRARLAAFSGKELAYLKLSADRDYGGESNTALPDGAGTFDVTVTSTSPTERRVEVTGRHGSSVFHLESSVELEPKAFQWAVTALGNFKMEAGARLLGDAYAAGIFLGQESAVITGDVDLTGSRSILKDMDGEVISVDGNGVPHVEGEVRDGAENLSFVWPDLTSLRTTAQLQGQYYTGGSVVFHDEDLQGVVYLAPGTDADFENVTIRGILVAEPARSTPSVINDINQVDSLLSVKSGCYLKLEADPGVVEDVALLAPASGFVVDADGWADVQGIEIAGFWKVRVNGDGVFTGPVYVNGKFACRGPALLQAPASSRDAATAADLFPDSEVKETGYVEP